jgi:3-oxoacyl-[acyl-carrier protein] reductase
MTPVKLSGRCAIVTGGSGGLGQAIVARLKLDGARVANFDREISKSKEQADLYCRCDVTNEESVNQSVRDVIAAFGGIGVLVNNAGLQGPVAPITAISLAEWRDVLDVNLTGTFLCCKAVVPAMIAAKWGRIINMSSVQGKEGTAEAGPYAASKAAQIALAKTLAKELATTGVTVNCIAPAVIDAGMISRISSERKAELLAKIPMRRFGTAAEVAAMVAWVASEECSFTTGAVFDLSGGRATWW